MTDREPGGTVARGTAREDATVGATRGGVLVIGYGSDLRGDDAAGRHVADAVGARDLPGVRVLSLPQLTPEVAADLATVDEVIFVDASVATATLTVAPVAPAPPSWRRSHHATPAALLALVATLDAPPPAALLVSIPVFELGIGTTLSPATTRAVDDAVACIVEHCTRSRRAAAGPAAGG